MLFCRIHLNRYHSIKILYLQYKNVRADYVKNVFKIANWRQVENYYEKAKV